MSLLRKVEFIVNVVLLFSSVEKIVMSELLEVTFIPYVNPTGKASICKL